MRRNILLPLTVVIAVTALLLLLLGPCSPVTAQNDPQNDQDQQQSEAAQLSVPPPQDNSQQQLKHRCQRKNEVWGQGSCCPATCKDPDRRRCDTIQCFTDTGCVCRRGFIRGENGRCVPEEQCQRCPGPNEVWSSSGACCPATCEDPTRKRCETVRCKTDAGCVCRRGFIQSKKGACVPEDSCEKKCPGKNEVWKACAVGDCWPTCQDPQPNCPVFKIACRPGMGKCVCRDGWIRRDGEEGSEAGGPCVRRDRCPSPPQCPPNAHPVTCKPCETACGERPRKCTKECTRGDFCACDKGWRRERPGGRCVRRCPRDNSLSDDLPNTQPEPEPESEQSEQPEAEEASPQESEGGGMVHQCPANERPAGCEPCETACGETPVKGCFICDACMCKKGWRRERPEGRCVRQCPQPGDVDAVDEPEPEQPETPIGGEQELEDDKGW